MTPTNHPDPAREAVDLRPADCRFRLVDEGKPYPRSRCRACGKGIATGLGRHCTVAATPAPVAGGRAEQIRAVAEIIANHAEPDGLGDWCGYADAAREIIAALATSPATPEPASSPATMEGVRVKPLEWQQVTPQVRRAKTILGTATIMEGADGYFVWRLGNEASGSEKTKDRAEKMLWATYESRILSALSPAPAATSTSGSDFARRWRQEHPDGTIDDLLSALDAALSPEAKERS